MTKSHYAIHGFKNHWVIDLFIVVQFTEVLDFCNSSLIVFEIVLLESKCDVLEEIINDGYHKVLMVSNQGSD